MSTRASASGACGLLESPGHARVSLYTSLAGSGHLAVVDEGHVHERPRVEDPLIYQLAWHS